MSVTLVALSVSGLTSQTAWMAGLAVVALVLVGWRKPARAQGRRPRVGVHRARTPVAVEHLPTAPYRRPNVLRRLWAAAGSLGLGVMTGAVAATIIAFAVAYAVVTLTSLLKQ